MNYYQSPLLYLYFYVQHPPYIFNHFISISNSTDSHTLLQTPNQSTIHHLKLNQIQFQNFLLTLKNLNLDQTNITYMQLGLKITYHTIPNVSDFQEIYIRTILRYHQTYKDEQKKTNWGKHDILILIWILDKYLKVSQKSLNNISQNDWNYISKMIPFRNGKDCMFKWLSLRQNRLEEYPWTKKQEKYLFKLMEENECNNWVNISKSLFKKFQKVYRSPKQCREHWEIHLNSQHERCKKRWMTEQDLKLIEAFEKEGRKWKNISRYLGGRSENSIKNRFNYLMIKYINKNSEKMNDKEKTQFLRSKISNMSIQKNEEEN